MPIWHILNAQSRFRMYFKKLKIQPKIVKMWSKTVPIYDFLPLFLVMPPEGPFPCLKMGKTKKFLTFCHILAPSSKIARETYPYIRTRTSLYP